MVKDRFGPLLGLWAIYFAITIALTIVFGIGMAAVGVAGMATMEESGNPLAMGGGMVVLVVLLYAGYLLLTMAQYASLILMASPTGRPAFGDALSSGWRAAPALLLLMVVLILGYVAIALLFGGAGSALGSAGGTVFALLMFPVLAWVGCRLALLFAVVAVDGVRNPFTAISRSWRLTDGHAMAIFLASLVFMVILVVICGVALLPSFGMLSSMADPESLAEAGGAAAGGMLLLMLGFLVASALLTIGYSAFMAVLHGTLTTAGGEGAAEAFA
jgi:hypothetical protein